MANPVALVIDDEPSIRQVLAHALAEDFTRVVEASTASDGLRSVRELRPRLVVLDLNLPDRPGIEACVEIRRISDAIILVLSARHADREKAALLDAGADDYVTKPFSTLELKARVRALLRRANAAPAAEAAVIRNADLTMDVSARTIDRGSVPIHLTPTEWELLRALMSNAGKTLTHRQLFSTVWPGRQFGDAQQYLRVHVANLRRKIEPNPLEPQYIFTEPGVGYRFVAAKE